MKLAFTAIVMVAAIAANAAHCKLPGCKGDAVERSQYCERHTCATEGCYAGVKIGGVPGWAAGPKKRKNEWGGGAEESKVPARIVWRHCQKHMCGRFCPRLNNEGLSRLLATMSEDNIVDFMGCPNERLNKSKFCLEHSCGVATCASAVQEVWSKKVQGNGENAPTKEDLTKQGFCMKHLSAQGNNKYERTGVTKETCSEYVKRMQEEKAARQAAKEAAAKEAAEKRAAAKAAKEAAAKEKESAEEKPDDAADGK